MNKARILQTAQSAGILAVVFYALHVVAGRLMYPDYKWLSQAVSDLSAIGAPSRTIAALFSVLYAACAIIGSGAIALNLAKTRGILLSIGLWLFFAMHIISGIGYSLFPLSEAGYAGSFSDIMHLYVVTLLVVLLSITSMIFFIIGGLRKKQEPVLALAAALTLAAMCFGAIASGALPKAYFGLWERFSVYSVVLFTGFCSLWARGRKLV